MSSRRKISLWLYREWIMSRSSSRTSAWKPWVSRAPAAGVSVVDAMVEFRVSFAGARAAILGIGTEFSSAACGAGPWRAAGAC